MIKIENLNKRFGTKVIFSNVNIDIVGNKIGVIGVNGAGKTTLANCIAGLTNYSGNITSDDCIGYCFSQNILPEYVSIYEIANTMKWDIKKLDYYLKMLYATEYKYEMIKNLSYGNCKKINIISTLFLNKKLLIFDELTNGLDVNAQINLIDLLKDETRDLLIISHDFNILNKVCDNFYLVDNNSIKMLNTSEISLEKQISNIVRLSDEN